MTLVIAGERSGVGKTTVTLALLAALCRRRLSSGQPLVQSFKVGPDYIDPMFHQFVTGRPCRNLDLMLTSEAYVAQCFQQHSQTADYALVEGVMGLFDGVTGKADRASTAHVSRLLNLPIGLVINCSSTSRSIAAIVHGYTTFDPRLQVAGVILNRVGSDRHLELLQDALASLQIPILGVLRRQDEISIPDRHLGLIPTAELPHLSAVIDRLAHLGETCFNWERLLPLLEVQPSPAQTRQAQSSPAQPVPPPPALTPDRPLDRPPLRLAIARDRAFNFYYADNLELLRAIGFELVEWSPITDRLPAHIHGCYLGGGFPEVFAAALSDNTEARQSVKAAIEAGMPTYAECGGLMYLCDRLIDLEAQAHPMVGIFPTTAAMGQRLTLGYRHAIAQRSTPLVNAGDRVWGHEFHRSSLTIAPEQPVFALQNYDQFARQDYDSFAQQNYDSFARQNYDSFAQQNCDQSLSQPEGWQRFQVHASYLHLHFGDRSNFLQRFWQQCQHYQARQAAVEAI